MAVFKCKMCGGTLDIKNNETVAVCEYCGTKQTLPRLDDEKRSNLYDRANHFRRNNEFDKALSMYEQLLNSDSKDAEAYWSCVLCRYGIEYVEDPATHKRVPTVNRAQYTSVFDDEDYKSALEYADEQQRAVYEKEAEAINEIQKGILAVSQKEEPFDIFICYKEIDSQGRRTPDSVLATDLYHQLTREGFKVFFSRITLEDKLGTAYEPYIFAALNSAKVMVVLGTKPEYFNAVWVKNEWSRYLALIKNGSDKILIPAYRDMDPYDLPEEFSHLQAQDMSKLGFMQDLLHGIKKIIRANAPKTAAPKTVIVNNGGSAEPLLKRAFLFLEDGEWQEADGYCEKVLDMNPECAEAYLGKLMAELKIHTRDKLKNCAQPFDGSNNYQKAVRFADEKLKKSLEDCVRGIKERNRLKKCEMLYKEAMQLMAEANTEQKYLAAANTFGKITDYKDASEQQKKCHEKADGYRKEKIYREAMELTVYESEQAYKDAVLKFSSIPGWRDADKMAISCQKKLTELKNEEEARRIAEEKRSAVYRKICISLLIAVLAGILIKLVIIPVVNEKIIFVINEKNNKKNYQSAIALYDEGKYYEALEYFMKAGGYEDSAAKIIEINKSSLPTLSTGETTIAVKKDGTVYAAGNNEYGQCNTENWDNIVSIDGYKNYTVGVKNDGTICSIGKNSNEIKAWNNVVQISSGNFHTVGLMSNGNVVASNANKYNLDNVCNWKNIIKISTNDAHTVGLTSDGRVLTVGSNYDGQCDVSDWNDIISIAAGNNFTVGLKKDGTVVAVGNNDDGQCDVSDWSNIIEIAAGSNHTVGLKSDGTVVAVGNNACSQCNVSQWADIAAIAAGGYNTAAIRKDGTVIVFGNNEYGQCNTDGWTDVKIPKAAGAVSE